MKKTSHTSHTFRTSQTKGFSLIELLIAIAILGIVGTAVATFQQDIFSLGFNAQANLSAQLDARHVIKQMVAELREASPSSLGGYPIALASTSAITFYSDINNDGLEDQIRYFMSGPSGTTLVKGVTAPSGSPLTYNIANEKVSTVITSLTNAASSTQPIFQYYDSSFSGTSSPLTQPVNIQAVRLIKITVILNKITATTEVEVRNLKDNL